MLQIISPTSPKSASLAASSSATSQHRDWPAATTSANATSATLGTRTRRSASDQARAASFDLADLLGFSRGRAVHRREPSACSCSRASGATTDADTVQSPGNDDLHPHPQRSSHTRDQMTGAISNQVEQHEDKADPLPPRYRHTIDFGPEPELEVRRAIDGEPQEERKGRLGPRLPRDENDDGSRMQDDIESDVTNPPRIQVPSQDQCSLADLDCTRSSHASASSAADLVLPFTSSPSLLSADLHTSALAVLPHQNPEPSSSSALSASSHSPLRHDSKGRHVLRHLMAERNSSELSFTCRGLDDEDSEPASSATLVRTKILGKSEEAAAAENAYKELDRAARQDPSQSRRSTQGAHSFSDSFDLFPSTAKSSSTLVPSSLLARRGMTSASFKTVKGSAIATGALVDPLGSAYRAKSLQQLQKRWRMESAHTGRANTESTDEDSEDDDDGASTDSSFSATQDDEDSSYAYNHSKAPSSGLIGTELFSEVLSHKLSVALEERKSAPIGSMKDTTISMVRQVSTDSFGSGSQKHRSPRSPCSIISPLSRKSSMASSRKGSQLVAATADKMQTQTHREKFRTAPAKANTLDDWSNAFTSIVDLQSPRPAPLPPAHLPLSTRRERASPSLGTRQESETSTPGAMVAPSLVSNDSRNTSRMHSPKTPMTASMHTTPSLPASRADSKTASTTSPPTSPAKVDTAADDGEPLPTSGLLARRSWQHTRSSSLDRRGKSLAGDQASSGLGLSFDDDKPTATVRQRGRSMGGEPMSGMRKSRRSYNYEHVRPPPPSLPPIPHTPYTPSTTAAATWVDPSLPANSYFPAQASKVKDAPDSPIHRSKPAGGHGSASARAASNPSGEPQSPKDTHPGKRFASVGSPRLPSPKLPSSESKSAVDTAVGQQLKRGLQSLALDVRFGLMRTKKKLSA